MKHLYLALTLVSVAWVNAEAHRIHIRVTHNKANATLSSVHRSPTKHHHDKDLGAGPRRKIYVLNSCPYNLLYQVGPIDGAPQPGTSGNWLGIQEENVITVAHNWRGLFTACQGDSCEVENGPQTRVEMSFDPSGVDYYDVSVVNGVNVPMSVEPLGVEYD